MGQFLFSKRYFCSEELNKWIYLKALALIISRFKTMLNVVLHTLTLQALWLKCNFKIYNIFNPLASMKHHYIVSALAVEAKNKKTTYYHQEPTIQFQKTITLHIIINSCQIFSASSKENYVYLIALHVYAFGCPSLLCIILLCKLISATFVREVLRS